MAKETFPTATPFLPSKRTIASLRDAAEHCKGCDLWTRAIQTVFGEGAAHASFMLVGEQPGDKEDLAGRFQLGS